MHVIGTLQRAPHRDPLRRIERRDHSVIFDVELLLRAGRILAFDDEVGLVPNTVDVAFLDQVCLEHVVRAPNNFRAALALFDREDARKRFVFDRHRLNRLGKNMAVGMGQQQNRLFGMIDELRGQTGLIVNDQRDAILARNIFRGDDYEFVPWRSLDRM